MIIDAIIWVADRPVLFGILYLLFMFLAGLVFGDLTSAIVTVVLASWIPYLNYRRVKHDQG